VLGVSLYLVVLGYWFRHRDAFTARRTVAFAGLLLLLYLSHLLPLGLGLMTIAVLGTGMLLADATRQVRRREPDRAALWRSVRSRALLPLLGSVPVLLLTAQYLARYGGSGTLGSQPPAAEAVDAGMVLLRLFVLAVFGGVVSLSLWETAVVAAYACVVFSFLFLGILDRLRGRVAWHGGDVLLVAVAAVGLFYLLVPGHMAGGALIVPRMGVMIYLLLLLWLGTQAHTAGAVRVLRTAAVCITLVLLAMRAVSYERLDPLLAEYHAAASYVQPNATLLSLSFAHGGLDGRGEAIVYPAKPFLHLAGYAAAQQRAVLINNYQGFSPVFPVRFRPQYLPEHHLGPQDLADSQIDLAGYAEQAGAPVDYVLLWGLTDEERAMPEYRELFRVLAQEYRLVEPASVSEHVRLYRHRLAPRSSRDPI
jgi:hypothetical protein